MLDNLNAELARWNISTKELAERIGTNPQTVRRKIREEFEFDKREMVDTKEMLTEHASRYPDRFPEKYQFPYTLEYLFESGGQADGEN